MSDSIKALWGSRWLGTPGRCGIAGACVSLVVTLVSFAGICAVIIDGTPGFIPVSWSYRWIAEVFFLWCIPFFLVIWKLTWAVLEEKFAGGDDIRDAQDRPAQRP